MANGGNEIECGKGGWLCAGRGVRDGARGFGRGGGKSGFRKGRLSVILTAAMAASVFLCFPALAASRDKVTSVKITLDDNLYPGQEVSEENLEVTSSSSNYDVTEWEIADDSVSGFSWQTQDVPRVEVRVECDDDHYFSLTKDKVKVKGDKATVVKIHKEDSQTLIVTLDLPPMKDRVGAIEYAYLDGTVASWAPAEGATGYELYLYRDSKAVGSKRTATQTTFNFGSSMQKAGGYYYRVRGVGAEGSKEGQFTESEELYKEAGGITVTSDHSGEWVADAAGIWWKNPDGTWPANEWKLIDQKWYFFNESGYMAVSQWILWKDLLYYVGPDGVMLVNTVTPDGHIVNADGALIQ